MTKWDAMPLVSVNGIKFGTSRDEVRKEIGLEYTEFKKSEFSKNTTDDFGVCHVYYDANNNCEAFEIFDEIEVQINGTTVFPTELNALKDVVPDLEEVEAENFISKNRSIGVYVPSGKMESILLATKGYFQHIC